MSGWGSAIYELGLAGVVFGLMIMFIFAKSILVSKKLAPAALASALLVTAVMLGSVPLALPVFGYIVGIHMRIADSDTDTALDKQTPTGNA